MAERKVVSLVVPMFNESDNIPHLVEHISAIHAANPDYEFELIAVDDGSSDDTVGAVVRLAPPTWVYTVVKLARNFGSHPAASAGFAAANGDCVILLGADMQEPVDLVADFLAAWENGNEVVWGIRESRAQSGLTLLISRLFSWLFHRYSDIKSYPGEGPSSVLCARSALDAVNAMKEKNRNLYGLIAWVGFTQTEVRYHQLPRKEGVSKWNRRSLLKLALDSFVQFSFAPIRAAAMVGSLIALVGFLYAAVLAARVILGAEPPEGWTTVVVLVLVVGGLQLVFLGLLGEYLWRAGYETRDRPLFLVGETIRSPARHDRPR